MFKGKSLQDVYGEVMRAGSLSEMVATTKFDNCCPCSIRVPTTVTTELLERNMSDDWLLGEELLQSLREGRHLTRPAKRACDLERRVYALGPHVQRCVTIAHLSECPDSLADGALLLALGAVSERLCISAFADGFAVLLLSYCCTAVTAFPCDRRS